jgi:hypothetical protein
MSLRAFAAISGNRTIQRKSNPIALYAQLIEQLRQEIAALTTVDAAKDAVFSRYERTRSAFRDEIARLSTA